MRRSAACIAILLALVSVGLADWVNIGPAGGPIYSGATATGTSPALYVASTNTSYPLLRSTDLGVTWQPAGAALSNYPRQLVAHPTDPNRLYGVVSSIFYRTTDAGATWTNSSLGSNNNGNDIALNPLNPQTVYVPTYKYDGAAWKFACTKSTDGGATWAATQLDTVTSSTIYSAIVDPVDTTVVYVGAYWNSTTLLYKSTDCGATWTRYSFPANAYYIYSFFIDPASHNTVFAGTLYGVYRSTDAGVTWTRQSTNNYNYEFARDPVNPNVMYSAAYTYLYRSTDAGLTWANSTSGIQGTQIRVVQTVPGQAGLVLAGSTAGMFKSTDYGVTWTEANDGIIIGKIPVVTQVPGQPGHAWAEFIDNDMFRTTDNGATWQHASTPLSCGNVCNIVFEPADPQRIWLLEGSG